MSTLFICPGCKTPVTISDREIRCLQCGKIGSITDKSIYDFSNNPVYWNQLNKATMVELIANAGKIGWKDTIHKYFDELEREKGYVSYICRQDRADFAYLVPVGPESVILDAGCGWGAITTQLARRARTVFGIDSTLETLQFLKIRAEQEGIHNITLVRTDPFDSGKLPFEDNMFDVISLIGVLEWIGSANTNEKPGSSQIKALKEFYRILKPGGHLCLGIESRYGIGFWMGRGDHPDTKYTSIAPRWLADILTQKQKKHRYTTWTYSHTQLKKLVTNAGFNIKSTFWPIPSYRFPEIIIPLDSWTVFSDCIAKYKSAKFRYFFGALRVLGLWKMFVEDYLFILNKNK
jgi:ubiquinone/menaquinone biosynthesis C-methylase UbiE